MKAEGTDLPRYRQLEPLIVAYTRFNAMRTLGDARPSAFRVERLGPLQATVDPARKASYYSRVLGLDAAALSALDAALEIYAAADLEPRIDVAAEDASDEVADALTARGFAPSDALLWWEADPADLVRERAHGIGADARIERWSEESADRFLDLLAADGAPIPPEIREDRRRHYCTDRFRTFIASIDGEPAAWATLFVHEGMGLFANAKTLPQFERRGLHGALVAARLQDAAQLGLTWVVTDVEPDTGSERNCRRAGLRLLTHHQIWERPTPSL